MGRKIVRKPCFFQSKAAISAARCFRCDLMFTGPAGWQEQSNGDPAEGDYANDLFSRSR